jgi:uncharacterized membrane protein
MDPTHVLLLAFSIGVICGLRALTAPACVAWGVHLGWIHLQNTPLGFMGSIATVGIFTLGAALELVADQLPSTPSRLKPPGLIARIAFGGLCGASVATAGGQTLLVGTCLGAVGSIVGAIAGYQARTRLVKALNVRDLSIALLEDVAAIAGGLLIASRF